MLSLIIINNHNYYKIKPNIQLSRVLVGGLQLALSTLGLIGNTLSIVLLSRCNLIMVVVVMMVEIIAQRRLISCPRQLNR